MQCDAGVEPGSREQQPRRMFGGHVGNVTIDHGLHINENFLSVEHFVSQIICAEAI